MLRSTIPTITTAGPPTTISVLIRYFFRQGVGRLRGRIYDAYHCAYYYGVWAIAYLTYEQYLRNDILKRMVVSMNGMSSVDGHCYMA